MRPTNLLLAFALSSMGLGTACTDAGEPLIILQNQVPEEGCVVPVTETNGFRPRGIIDVQSASGYLFTPLVQNNAVTLEANPNTRIASVQGATVKLTLQEGSGVDVASPTVAPLIDFTKRFSGSIQPDGGLSSFSFTIIDKNLLDAMAGSLGTPDQRLEVEADIRVFARMGGGEVESLPFVYVVDVCNGCMLVDVGPCANLPDGFTPLQGGVCNPLQDVFTECCTEIDDTLTCPAVSTPVVDPL